MLLAGLAVATFALSVSLHHAYFDYYSGDADEGVYVLQAKMLRQGHVTLPADQAEFFQPWLTGEHSGRLFTQYLPGWPALLAASDWLFATMAVAPAFAAAGWVIATYGLTLELLGDRRTSLIAAALVALCPIVLLHGALYLSYGYSAAAVTAGAWWLLRGARTERNRWLVAAGAAFGAALLARPFDVLLFATPMVAYLAWQRRAELARVARYLLFATAGALPFVAILLAYNAHVTGNPLRAPLSASDPLNRFGFGDRRILPGQALIDYSFPKALTALVDNVQAVPSWLLGGAGLILLAAVGLLLPARRPARLVLVALVVAFPAGYLFWWATSLSASNAVNGIGPHYYLPVFAPIAALAASALALIWVRRRVLAIAALVVLALLTAPSLGPKLDVARYVHQQGKRISALIPRDLPTPSVIIVRDSMKDSRFVGASYQFLSNDPQLRQPILYAAPRGAIEHRLGAVVPGRRIFRLDTEALRRPEELFGPRGSIVELSTVRSAQAVVHLHIRNTTNHRFIVAYAGEQTRVLDTQSTPGSTYDTEWIVAPRHDDRVVSVDQDKLLVVGVATADQADLSDAERWEQRISTGPIGANRKLIELQLPGYPWRRIAFYGHRPWLPGPLGPTLEVTVTPSA